MFYSAAGSGTVHIETHRRRFALKSQVINVSQWLWIKNWRLQVFLDGKMEAVCMATTGVARGPGSCYRPSEWRGAPVPPPPHQDRLVLAPDKSRGDSWAGRASVSTFPNAHIHPYPRTKNSTAEGRIPHLVRASGRQGNRLALMTQIDFN